MNTPNTNKQDKNEISLYRLIEAVEDVVSPDEKDLVPFVVKDLLDSGRVKVYCKYSDCSQLPH